MRLRFWRKQALPDEERQALERWVRYRVRMLDSDPWGAILGAVARLTGAGMDRDTAIATVVKIMHEEEQRASGSA